MDNQPQGNQPPLPAEARAGSHSWFQWYPVQAGDTLSEIAEWWYGSATEPYWRRIWLANRRTIGEDPNVINEGQWLKLPYWRLRYRIVQGDTLFQLAEWVYGDGTAFLIILQANPWIPNVHQIQAGWWIWIE